MSMDDEAIWGGFKSRQRLVPGLIPRDPNRYDECVTLKASHIVCREIRGVGNHPIVYDRRVHQDVVCESIRTILRVLQMAHDRVYYQNIVRVVQSYLEAGQIHAEPVPAPQSVGEASQHDEFESLVAHVLSAESRADSYPTKRPKPRPGRW